MDKDLSFNNVLHVSPYYKLKGGVSSVIHNYKTNNKDSFKHFYSMYFSNKLLNVFVFPLILTHYLVLIINPTIKIVHLHCAKKGSFYRKYIFLKIAVFFNKKVVFHIHSGQFYSFYLDSNSFVKKRIEQVLIKSDAVVVLTNYWKDYFYSKFIINNLVVVNNLVPFQEKKEKNINPKLQLLFLGDIGKRKGIFDLLDSIEKYKDEFSGQIKLFVAGIGERNKIINKIKEYELEDDITYLGWISGLEKQKVIEKSDIIVLPSYAEGLPMALLEAMSFSMPVISSNIIGILDILENNKNGKVIIPGDIDSIACAINYYIDNKKMIAIHGDESYNIAKNYFPTPIFQQLSQLYKSI
ncbi:MAG: glycosyltransferase family 4 protein [Bacteroidota bacterium]|nr:glycosyltransferase family 4 protein [Bacteroidota bacterium]